MYCQCWKCSNSGYQVDFGREYIAITAQACDGSLEDHIFPRESTNYQTVLESMHCNGEVRDPKPKMDQDLRHILYVLGACLAIAIFI